MLLRVPGQVILRCLHSSFRNNVAPLRCMSTKAVVDEKPPEYIGSEAWKWKAENNRRGPEKDIPWFQPYVVSLSTAVFMIYFCILREENDLDEKLGNPMYVTAPQLEKSTILVAYKYNKENGLDTTDLEARLKEIEMYEQKKSASVVAK